MSRIGSRPIYIHEGVKVSLADHKITAKSSLGELDLDVPKVIALDLKENVITLKRENDEKVNRALHGLYARLVRNMLSDVKNGVEKILEFNGTGYRARVEEENLILNLGFSHEIVLRIPNGLSTTVNKNRIIISGINRQKVGNFAAEIRSIRPPEVYKGKGIKYLDESIKKKAGKAAQATIVKA